MIVPARHKLQRHGGRDAVWNYNNMKKLDDYTQIYR